MTDEPAIPIPFQVTFDSLDPHGIAMFWAEALGYEKEDNSLMVDQLVSAGRVPESEVIVVDGKSALKVGAALRDPAGNRPRLLFQLVPEGKTVKNRVHLDLRVGEARIDDEVARLKALGATEAWESSDRGGRCVTLRDPEGNEFCVT